MNNSSKKKKIVFKIPEFPQVSETFLIAQIQTAITLGFDVKIITRKFLKKNIHLTKHIKLKDYIIIDDYKIPKNKLIRFLKWLVLIIVNIKDVFFINNYYKTKSKFSLTWLFEFHFYKKFNDFDIMHVQYGTYKYPIDILKKINFFKPEVIVTFHGHDAFFPLYGYIQNNGYYDILFENEIVITANTKYLAQKLEELGCPNNKIEIIPVAVDTSFFCPRQRIVDYNKQIKLITVGRLDKVKGHHYCIDVVRALRDKGLNVKLSIIGEGAERHNLEMLIKKYNLEDFVFLLGSGTPEEVRSGFWNHHLYLLLSVPVENNRKETQGLATLEAQACGLPALVFDSGGVKYTVENEVSGFVFKTLDVEGVINKIEVLYRDTVRFTKMRNDAVSFVEENFSQIRIDEKWRKIYKK
ncbi:glycosyltransferase family 4 protein [Olleya sp. 1-3]|uniref:glycosyltransferase family 4 protein n=1 Tax=Olleya sp. 1-3 TaxID=2058323 RepID=UPI000C347A3F|nr:glycosyltransferase family 4 protein [Olleya sp. 1-3]PKG51717.1 hypothetical protein CXF54_06880 [Olleya sp. 1-3]